MRIAVAGPGQPLNGAARLPEAAGVADILGIRALALSIF